MDSAKIQLADKLKGANNILVTVSRDPSVDQLAALLGFTLLLNKYGKHAAAVFSGQVPPTIEFLQPEATIEKNTDSLRDFIIALDKRKADKLRYKVEDDVVRIFITPYKTSISQDDLEFSQGDFNVDVVVALGVQRQEDLDEAITAHGRILHDATVASLNVSTEGGLGAIVWNDPSASSLSELVAELAQVLGEKLLDPQIATALLTGIVAETERFSNHKTTSVTMSLSAALMAAGADQQLVASKLQEEAEPESPAAEAPAASGLQDQVNDETGQQEAPKREDGTLEIDHESVPQEVKTGQDREGDTPDLELPAPQLTPEESATDEQTPDEPVPEEEKLAGLTSGSRLITEPPQLGGQLTANTRPEALDPVTDPLSMLSPDVAPMLSRGVPPKAPDLPASTTPQTPEEPEQSAATPAEVSEQPAAPEGPQQPGAQTTFEPSPQPSPAFTPPPVDWQPPSPEPPAAPAPIAPAPQPQSDNGQPTQPTVQPMTLADIESANATGTEGAKPDIDSVRDEISKALNDSSATQPPEPIQALNAQPLADNLHAADANTEPPHTDATDPSPSSGSTELDVLNLNTEPTAPAGPPAGPAPGQTTEGEKPAVNDPNAPPPVPPPIPFQFGSTDNRDNK